MCESLGPSLVQPKIQIRPKMKKEFYLSSPSNGRYEVVMKITSGDVDVARILILTFEDYLPASSAVVALQVAQYRAIL